MIAAFLEGVEVRQSERFFGNWPQAS